MMEYYLAVKNEWTRAKHINMNEYCGHNGK